MERETILLIEDEKQDQDYIRQKVEEHYQLKIAQSYQEALKALEREDFDYIFLDLRLPKKTGDCVDEQGTLGVKLLKTIKEKLPLVPVVVISGLQSSKIAIKLLEYGFVDFVDKDELDIWLEPLLKKGRQLKNICLQNKILRHEILGSPSFAGLITKSKIWDEIKKTIAQVAQTDETVLITGDTGTGKEVVAREIFNLSLRKENLYNPVNCTEFSSSLLESELFGHEKGAFTGADNRKMGIFEAAHNGTVFLDEIGDISEEMQAKLLRVLQEKEIRRIGSNKTMKVNVRIIAATNHNLTQLIEDKKFRQDLYSRLNRYEIHIPPLQKRKYDIDVLAPHFIKKYCRKYGKSEKRLPPKTLKRLKNHDWPENVRGLENMVSRAVLLSQSDTLFPEDFDVKISEFAAKVIESVGCLDLGVIEKEAVRRALSSSKTKKEAYSMLGISDKTLNEKITKYNLSNVGCPQQNDIPETEVAPLMEKEQLTSEQRQILDHIRENEFITNKTALQMFGVARKTIVAWCQQLMDKGLIIREGSGRSTKYIAGSGKTALA